MKNLQNSNIMKNLQYKNIAARLVGKTLDEATAILKENGIVNIQVIDNYIKPLEGSTLLVLNAQVESGSAKLVMGSFKLDL